MRFPGFLPDDPVWKVRQLFAAALASRVDLARRSILERDPDALVAFEHAVFSQNGEDGILAEIFRRIGTTNRRFVELGSGSGLENCTAALLLDGWSGLWVDGSPKHARAIRQGLPNLLASGLLRFSSSLVDRSNVNEVIDDCGGAIDLLVIDLDGNDGHVLEALGSAVPRVIVVEYNARFAPPICWRMPYDSAHEWSGTAYFGASLSWFTQHLESRDYELVGCDSTGTNAFFVLQSAAAGRFVGPNTAERHWNPFRPGLHLAATGHRPEYRILDAAALQ